jgi:membrane fusion protein (multidrug efflux system)
MLGVGLLFTWLALGCGAAPGPAEEESHPAPVKVASAQTVRLGEWTELLGATQPLPGRIARVSAAVEGHVVSVLGDGSAAPLAEGQRVQSGQVIARLDDRIAQANLGKMTAQLTEAEEATKQARYAIDLAQLEVKRLEDLRRGASSALVARVEVEKAGITLKEAQSKQQAVAAREAVLRADLKGQKAQLDFYSLRAPINGTLGLVQVAHGQTLTPGATVAEIVDLDEIDALCYVPPRVAPGIRLGKPGKLLDREAPPGKVVFLGVQAQADTGNVAVKVRFPNPKAELRANTVVRLRVETGDEKDRLVVPEAAVLEDQDPPAVVVVREVHTKKDDKGKEETLGKAVKLQVVLGVRDRAQKVVELREMTRKDEKGKEEKVPVAGAQFVVEGANGLHDGDEVKIEADEHAKE